MGASRRFDALGTGIEICLPDDAEPVLDQVEQRIRALEDLWSRFRPDSELSRLNRAAGEPIRVSGETCRVLGLAVEGYELTGETFDPRVLNALEAAGYRASRETLEPATAPPPTTWAHRPTSEVSRLPLTVEIDEVACTAALPIGDRWDLGGIGKGFAADLATEELAADGVESIMVNLGGDIRVFGAAFGEPCWTVQVDNPFRPGDPIADVHLLEGGVATSSRTKRRWIHDGRPQHHVIDPRSGRPAETDLVAVTVVAGATWWAEVLAKSALILGRAEGCDLVERHGCSAALVGVDGALTVVGEHIREGVKS